MESSPKKRKQGPNRQVLTYINAAYLGLISAIIILFFEFYLEGMKEHFTILAWILVFYSSSAYFMGRNLKGRGILLGLALSLPLGAVTYWIPEALAQSAFDDKKFVVLLPIAAFIVAMLAHIISKRKSIINK